MNFAEFLAKRTVEHILLKESACDGTEIMDFKVQCSSKYNIGYKVLDK